MKISRKLIPNFNFVGYIKTILPDNPTVLQYDQLPLYDVRYLNIVDSSFMILLSKGTVFGIVKDKNYYICHEAPSSQAFSHLNIFLARNFLIDNECCIYFRSAQALKALLAFILKHEIQLKDPFELEIKNNLLYFRKANEKHKTRTFSW